MADGTKIEWAHAGLGRGASWNPVRARNLKTGAIGHHCEHKSPGCIYCYSETWNRDRLGTRLPFKPGLRKHVEIFLDEKTLRQPLGWRAPRGIFAGSMTDLFADFVTDEMLDRIFAVAALCPQHRFLFLTKRPERMCEYFFGEIAYRDVHLLEDRHVAIETAMNDIAPAHLCKRELQDYSDQGLPLPNVWLGTSVEDQPRADERREYMRKLAEAGWITFVSYEPALECVDWTGWGFLKQLISGGESGPNARPSHPDWFRVARDWCAPNDVAYFHKQWGRWVTEDQSPLDIVLPSSCTCFWGAVDDDGNRTGDQTCVYDVGKHRAGRLLDGVEHNGFPKVLG